MDNIRFVPVPAALQNAVEEVTLKDTSQLMLVESTDSTF
jgi:hypothetical protein